MKNICPKISIIIPVYNGESHLRQCIKSVLNQTLRELEVICIDDGSNDNSAQIIREFSSKDNRILLLQQKNQGPGPAKNLGLKNAKGKYVAFLDSDDYYLESDALEKMVNACERTGALVCASMRKVLVDGIEKNEELFQNIDKNILLNYVEYQMDYDYQNYLFNREFLLEKKCCFPPYRRFEDPVFLTRVLFEAKVFTVADTYLYCYRLPLMITRFTPQKTVELLRGIEDNLIFSIERNLNRLFQVTMDRLEYEYFHIILKNIPVDDLNIIHLLLRINQMIRKQIKKENYIIRPLRGILLFANEYEKKLLDRIKQKNKIALYGAGHFGKIFYSYLKEKQLSEKVVSFIVSKREAGILKLEDMPILTLDEVKKTDDIYILVTVREEIQQEIVTRLEDKGFCNYEILDWIYLCIIAEQMST